MLTGTCLCLINGITTHPIVVKTLFLKPPMGTCWPERKSMGSSIIALLWAPWMSAPNVIHVILEVHFSLKKMTNTQTCNDTPTYQHTGTLAISCGSGLSGGRVFPGLCCYLAGLNVRRRAQKRKSKIMRQLMSLHCSASCSLTSG